MNYNGTVFDIKFFFSCLKILGNFFAIIFKFEEMYKTFNGGTFDMNE